MRKRGTTCMLPVLMMLLAGSAPATADPLNLIFPTRNQALLDGDGPSFYQYTDRNFNGVKSRPWQGGQYGFVRNPKETAAGIVFTRFHEGVDIKPVYRDYNDEPLDTVRAIDEGVVVYTNHFESYSSYGKYVVVEHWWSGSPFYSLYAHLNGINVRKGQRLRQGDRIGRLGYTGPGLNKRRAHLHFEINMLLNEHFQSWFDRNYRTNNRHDLFNGVNLAGIDVAELYLAAHREPTLTITQFFARQKAFFRIAVKNDGLLDLTSRYGWMVSYDGDGDATGRPRSWEISFTESGLPIRIEASQRAVSEPTVTYVQQSSVPYAYLTGGLVSGSYNRFSLASSGKRYTSLLTLFAEERQIVEYDLPNIIEASDLEDGESFDRLRTW